MYVYFIKYSFYEIFLEILSNNKKIFYTDLSKHKKILLFFKKINKFSKIIFNETKALILLFFHKFKFETFPKTAPNSLLVDPHLIQPTLVA